MADSELRIALEYFREGEIMLMSGIDNDFQPSFSEGVAKINEGSLHLDRSYTIGNQAYCSPDR